MRNVCQDLPHTWRMSSILLRFLMVILMAGVILTEPEVSVDVDADAVADAELMLS